MVYSECRCYLLRYAAHHFRILNCSWVLFIEISFKFAITFTWLANIKLHCFLNEQSKYESMERFKQVNGFLHFFLQTDMIKGVAIFVKTGFRCFQKFYFSVLAAKQRRYCALLQEQWRKSQIFSMSHYFFEKTVPQRSTCFEIVLLSFSLFMLLNKA